jgi:hypothetical protein
MAQSGHRRTLPRCPLPRAERTLAAPIYDYRLRRGRWGETSLDEAAIASAVPPYVPLMATAFGRYRVR